MGDSLLEQLGNMCGKLSFVPSNFSGGVEACSVAIYLYKSTGPRLWRIKIHDIYYRNSPIK